MYSSLLVPSNLILLLAAAGFVCLATRRKRAALRFFTTALALYVFLGTAVLSSWMIASLEKQYPRVQAEEDLRDAKQIVILAGYAEKHPLLPLSSSVNFPSAYRLVEGLRIARMLPDSTVLVSGKGQVPAVMKELLVSMGMPAGKIQLDRDSVNTYESAINVKRLAGNRQLVLVTSAGHMPRAVRCFRKVGLDPAPAPTNHMRMLRYRFTDFLPSPAQLVYSDLAVREYIGIFWYRLTDRI